MTNLISLCAGAYKDIPIETGIISLERKKQPIYDTLASALGGILLNAEKKNIEVLVHCPESIEVTHDKNGRAKPCSIFWTMR